MAASAMDRYFISYRRIATLTVRATLLRSKALLPPGNPIPSPGVVTEFGVPDAAWEFAPVEPTICQDGNGETGI